MSYARTRACIDFNRSNLLCFTHPVKRSGKRRQILELIQTSGGYIMIQLDKLNTLVRVDPLDELENLKSGAPYFDHNYVAFLRFWCFNYKASLLLLYYKTIKVTFLATFCEKQY